MSPPAPPPWPRTPLPPLPPWDPPPGWALAPPPPPPPPPEYSLLELPACPAVGRLTPCAPPAPPLPLTCPQAGSASTSGAHSATRPAMASSARSIAVDEAKLFDA
ncbi:hypothetical protein B5U98_12415 [Bosea sp. Tri-39]|nr:hypothetical protein B5U98_12415 [Bosea sp. Tri-39]RXT38849.1 hypothetical protein B5U99_11865 [Bosea sp. Tri-54]